VDLPNVSFHRVLTHNGIIFARIRLAEGGPIKHATPSHELKNSTLDQKHDFVLEEIITGFAEACLLLELRTFNSFLCLIL
jgi:hypothetical protein